MYKMKKIIVSLVVTILILLPLNVSAAGGIYASGGGAKTVGQSFYVTVTASGATFNALQGTISISGPVKVIGFSAGNATWMTTPTSSGSFVGMVTTPTSSLKVATIKLRGTSVGSGAVSISGVQLANAGAIVGTGANSTSFSISRAPTPPEAIAVTSTTHPDQETQYEETAVTVNWTKPKGVTNMAWAWDESADTTPSTNTSETSMTFSDQAVGIHYFHLRAKNADGWGEITHFKVQIKEPDPKIDESLDKPSNIKVEKSDYYINDIETGMVTGLAISGQTEGLYNANISLTPKPEISEDYLKTKALEKLASQKSDESFADNNEATETVDSEKQPTEDESAIDTSAVKPYTAQADKDGKFALTLDFPIATGHYILTVQGQKEKVLTPISDKIIFEISQKDGGEINILTEDDTNEPAISPIVKGTFLQNKYTVMHYLIVTLALAILILIILQIIKFVRRRRDVI